jgi:gamma-glutamylcyclotransferase
MTTFYYFAYGSNMLTARLRERCPSAVVRTTAVVRDHIVVFGKRSIDHSGKASLRALAGPKNIVRGVVFEIANEEVEGLDDAEGSGYSRRSSFHVECLRTGDTINTCTYFATKYDDELRPYDWYLALVLAGITEHGLGEEYAATVRAICHHSDPQPSRKSRQDAIRVLESVGLSDYTRLLVAAS